MSDRTGLRKKAGDHGPVHRWNEEPDGQVRQLHPDRNANRIAISQIKSREAYRPYRPANGISCEKAAGLTGLARIAVEKAMDAYTRNG